MTQSSRSSGQTIKIQLASIPFEWEFPCWAPHLLDRLFLLKVPPYSCIRRLGYLALAGISRDGPVLGRQLVFQSFRSHAQPCSTCSSSLTEFLWRTCLFPCPPRPLEITIGCSFPKWHFVTFSVCKWLAEITSKLELCIVSEVKLRFYLV